MLWWDRKGSVTLPMNFRLLLSCLVLPAKAWRAREKLSHCFPFQRKLRSRYTRLRALSGGRSPEEGEEEPSAKKRCKVRTGAGSRPQASGPSRCYLQPSPFILITSMSQSLPSAPGLVSYLQSWNGSERPPPLNLQMGQGEGKGQHSQTLCQGSPGMGLGIC